MKAARILLTYGIVFSIGLWLGYKFASTEKGVTSSKKETSESVVKMGNEASGNRGVREGNV